MSIFEKEVLQPVRDALDGKVLRIPIHLERVSEVLSLRKNIYTIVGGNTGSGKTSFVDDTFVLKPFQLWNKFKDTTDVTFRVLYRSMERRRSLKLTKWACWKMYQDHGILIDSETLLGYKKAKVSEAIWNILVEARDWADMLLDYIDIRDGRTSPDDYNHWVTNHAIRNGTLYVSDTKGVYDFKQPGTYIDTFSTGKEKTLANGEKVQIVVVTHKGETITLRQNERYYFPNREKEITIVVGDHVGKFVGQTGLTSKKQIIDKASEHNADFRDVFGYSPVGVSQFNRAIGDVQRMKFSDGDLSPQLEDFKDTGNLTEDADLVIALFNPYRYKSFDDNGMYKGYNIRDEMVNPFGHNRYRLISILKNSYGIDDVDFGLKFLGEVNDFTTLPKPGPDNQVTQELQKVYKEIQQGK